MSSPPRVPGSLDWVLLFFFPHSLSKSLLSPAQSWVRSTGKPSSRVALPRCPWGRPSPPPGTCTTPQAFAKEPACQCRRHRRCTFDPWVRKSPWSRKWQPTPRGCKELDMTEHTGFTQVCTRPHCPSGAPCAAPAFTTHQLWEGHSLPGPLTSARPHSQDRPPSHTSEGGMREGWGRGRNIPSHPSHILFTRERLRLVFSQRWGQPGSRSGHSLARAPGSVRGKQWGSINGRFLNNTPDAFSARCCTDVWASLVAQMIKNLPANAGDLGSIPGSGRSPGEGNGDPLQYSYLENVHIQQHPCPLTARGQQHSMPSSQPEMTRHPPCPVGEQHCLPTPTQPLTENQTLDQG